MKTLDFVAYSIGLCYAGVCSSLSPEETAERMNIANPTGISSPWKIAEDATFESGQPNPCPCDMNPETHKHYLMSC